MDTDNLDFIDNTALKVFGIRCLKPNQKLLIEKIHNYENSTKRENLLALLSTGFGKSICFLLPSYLSNDISILIFPVISLMNDQSEKLRKLNIPFVLLKGGMSWEEKQNAFKQLSLKKSRLIITNPEMLTQESILTHLREYKFSFLVLDEAHTVISWGETFRPAYLNLPHAISTLNPKAILAFSATCNTETVDRLKELIFTDDPYVFISSADRENIIYRRVRSLFPLLDIKTLLESVQSRKAIIYCGTRKKCEIVSAYLSAFYPTRYYHAGLDKDERIKTEAWFRDEDGAVLAATNAFGLGVDSKHVRTVIHLYLPDNSQDYLQEAGRAGRDGLESTSYVLLNPFNKSPLYELFTTDGCIRSKLIQTLGRPLVEACSGCDGCEGKYTQSRGEQIVKKAIGIPYFHSRIEIIRRLMRMTHFDRNTVTRALDRAIEFGLVTKRFKRYKWVKNK
ncbi:MAG: RecQ family ATP-dependent DNA helicase [Sphaerochaetaceae bacterium]|nr:RecQ family ATP-dependent DNA helicase [Sphaerochaetaceae bacterium]